MAKITVALLGVENPGNLGAVARAMKNFGFSDLALIDAKCKKDHIDAKNRAKWAKDVLEHARAQTMEDLGTDYDLVIGTTGKLGDDYNLPRTPLFPSQLPQKFSEAPEDARVCLLFGRESDGLYNHELELCDFMITIPTAKEYPSLNLSHAVAVVLYAVCAPRAEGAIAEKYPLLRAAEKQHLRRLIEETVTMLDFPAEAENHTQEVLWTRLVGKSLITQREAMALMGFFRRVQWHVNKEKK